MIRRSLLALAFLAITAGPLAAQERKDLEVGLVLRYGVYDVGVGVDGAAGLGGRLGIFLSPTLILEAEGAYHRPQITDGPGSVVHELYQTRLLFVHWLGRTGSLVLGGGFAYDHYRGPRPVGARGFGPAGLMGLRFRLRDSFALRLDGVGYLIPAGKGTFPVDRTQTMNVGVQAGLSVLMRSPGSGQ